MKNISIRLWLVGCAVLVNTVACLQAQAQLNPPSAIYFQNQYLANPAWAGAEGGATVNLGYRRQWNDIEQAPVTQYFSGVYKFDEKAGVGAVLYSEKAGLLRRTKIMASYGYHLPLATDRTLHLGLSAGVMSEKISTSDIHGDLDDPTVARFNDRGLYVDGDFGVAYTDHSLTLQASIPNIRSTFESEDNPVDKSLFFAAASYAWVFERAFNTVRLEPKVIFRGVKGHDNIVDVGADVRLENQRLNFFALYHSTKNATLGAGLEVIERLTLTAMFTSETSGLREQGGGTFEFGLKGKLLGKEK
jgi:type IX secretion system PorP/SprF family membrane protein